MNIMTKLALRQMRLAKRRTAVTIAGVIISVAMITAVSTFAGSFMDLFHSVAVAQEGDWHVQYQGVAAEKLEVMSSREDFGGWILTRDVGTQKLEVRNGGKQFISVQNLSADGMERAQMELLTGRLPETETELVISKSFSERNMENFEIGDEVSLMLGSRYDLDGSKLAVDDYYQEDMETYEPGQETTYRIVGVADMGILEESWKSNLAAFTNLDEAALLPGEGVDVRLKLEPLDKNIYKKCEAMSNELEAENMSYNTEVLFYSGQNPDESLMLTFYLVGGILTLIIMTGSIALIYNAFAISVSERSKQFGMLTSAGATGRQRRNAVFAEAGIISLLAIPPGILAGLLGIGITFRIVNPLLSGALVESGASLRLVVLPHALIGAVLVSLLTIFLSALIPALRAQRITPIEAIRETKNVRLSPKVVKTSGLVRMMFGFEGELALKNLKRNRKRYLVTLFSLIISLVLFLSAYSFSYYMKGAYGMTQGGGDYDIAVTAYARDVGYENQKRALLNALADLPGMEAFSGNLEIYLPEVKTEEQFVSHEAMEDYKQSSEFYDSDMLPSILEGSLVGLDDKTMREYAQRLGLSWESLNDVSRPAGIVINEMVYKQKNEYTTVRLLKKGAETLELVGGPRETGIASPLRIAALTGELPSGAEKKTGNFRSAEIYVTMDVFDAIVKEFGTIQNEAIVRAYINCEDPVKMEQAVSELCLKAEYANLDSNIANVNEMIKRDQQMFLAIDIFVFGFVTLIALIGTANIFNTMRAGLDLRKREFAMLKSVGMSPKSFRRMIRFESLLYGMKTVLYGLPAGLAVMALIYLALARNFEAAFSIPWEGVVLGILLIFAMIVLTMVYSERRLRKDTIVDALRSDTI